MKNIFAKVIYTSNENIKNLILKKFDILDKETKNDIEIYHKSFSEFNKILRFICSNIKKR